MTALALRPRAWPRPARFVGLAVLGVLLAALVAGPALRLVDAQPVRLFGIDGARKPVAALYLSGDMGVRLGTGPEVAPALAAQGLPLVAFSSPKLFGERRDAAAVDAIVARTVRAALARSGAERIVLIGQSFGADILAATVPALPADLRARIGAIVLVVPASTVYFRADPLGLAYHGTPDAIPAPALRDVRWAPVICIRGALEKDAESLCPALTGSPARSVTLPGGHALRRDFPLIVSTIIGAVRAADPSLLAGHPTA